MELSDAGDMDHLNECDAGKLRTDYRIDIRRQPFIVSGCGRSGRDDSSSRDR